MDKHQSEQLNQQRSRRKFIQKAGAGIVLSSFPVRSVWANGGGLTGSIVASGAGSKYGQESAIALKPAYFFVNNALSLIDNGIFTTSYKYFFGQAPTLVSGQYDNSDPDPTIFEVLVRKDVTLGTGELVAADVKTGVDPKTFSKDDKFMVVMLLNAYYHGHYGIEYPIIGAQHSSQFANLLAYGDNLAGMSYPGIYSDIKTLINNNPTI